MADSQRKTANLFDSSTLANDYTLQLISGLPYPFPKRIATLTPIDISSLTSVTLSYQSEITDTMFIYSIFNGSTLVLRVASNHSGDIIDVSGGDKIYISFYSQPDNITIDNISNIMLNEGSSPLPYEPYWQHSLRKLTTATDTITTLPADLYADGNNATVGLVGNMQQTGTPTSQNPIQPSECGERMAQLWDISSWDGATAQRGTLERVTNGYKLTATSNDAYTITYGSGIYSYSVIGGNEYTISWTVDNPQIYGVVYIFTGTSVADTSLTTAVASSGSKTFTVPSGHNYVAFCLGVSSIGDEITYTNIMLNTGSTAKPFEPYGYKLDIKSANTTTPVYLGEVESTRKIYKFILDGTEDWKVLSSDNSKYYLDYLANDYLRADSQITYMCTHYISYKQTVSATLVPNLKMSMSSGGAQRLYIADANFTTTDQFKAYLAQQYANGTPVTVWYVLATPTTGIVNEPLRKIGDYADSITGVIVPTITGADSFDVQTTLKPSEVSLTYTGWHDAMVKEWDGSEWQ